MTIFEPKMSDRHFIHHHMPDNGCILFFSVPRSRICGAVGDTGCLSIRKVSPAPLGRGNTQTTPADYYICWKEG